jgi:hypothetical protein
MQFFVRAYNRILSYDDPYFVFEKNIPNVPTHWTGKNSGRKIRFNLPGRRRDQKQQQENLLRARAIGTITRMKGFASD